MNFILMTIPSPTVEQLEALYYTNVLGLSEQSLFRTETFDQALIRHFANCNNYEEFYKTLVPCQECSQYAFLLQQYLKLVYDHISSPLQNGQRLSKDCQVSSYAHIYKVQIHKENQ